jgi:hypothetical protein
MDENLIDGRLIGIVYGFEEIALGTAVFVELEVELAETEFAVYDVGKLSSGVTVGRISSSFHGVRNAADGFQVAVKVEEVAHQAYGEHFVAHLAAVGKQ